MPRNKNTRLISEQILESDDLAGTPPASWWFWLGLLLKADDQGRFRANTNRLYTTIFMNDEEGVHSPEDCQEWLAMFEEKRMLILYHGEDERTYGQIVNWWTHQRMQFAMPSEFPSPDKWDDRIRYNNGAENGIVTFNWALRNGTRLDDTCDERGKPLPKGGTPSDGPADGPGDNSNKPDAWANRAAVAIAESGLVPHKPILPAMKQTTSTKVKGRGTPDQKNRLRSAKVRIQMIRKGLFPKGQGENAVEIYYESFPAFNAATHLSDLQIGKLEETDLDFDGWRETCEYWALADRRKKDIPGMLANYKGGKNNEATRRGAYIVHSQRSGESPDTGYNPDLEDYFN